MKPLHAKLNTLMWVNSEFSSDVLIFKMPTVHNNDLLLIIIYIIIYAVVSTGPDVELSHEVTQDKIKHIDFFFLASFHLPYQGTEWVTV